jgi:excinuclease ABC subunit A
MLTSLTSLFTNHSMSYLIQKKNIWTGNSYFQGLNDFLRNWRKNYKIQNRVMLSHDIAENKMPFCKGKRFRIEASYENKFQNCFRISRFTIKHLSLFFQEFRIRRVWKTNRETFISRNKQPFILLTEVAWITWL